MNQKRYAYLIGANGPENMRLKYAETDIIRLAEALQEPYCQFTAVESVIAHSRDEGLASFKSFAEQCEPPDLLLVHFSGHAYFDTFDQQLYLFCNNTDSNNLITAIEIDAIKRILHRSLARYKLLILDCCQAKGAYEDGLKGEEEVQNIVKKIAQGNSTAILSACARNDRTREFSDLDGGSGFLSWAIREACSTHFTEASSNPNQRTLSLSDLDHWIEKRLHYVNTYLSKQQPLPTPYLYRDQPVGNEIWLTPPPLPESIPSVVRNEENRKRYLEQVYKSYNSMELPIGPVDGLALQAIFQPLVLRRDPLTVKDLKYEQRRKLLGEITEKIGTERYELSQREVQQSDEKKNSSVIIAEHGEDALRKSSQGRVLVLGGPGTGKTTMLKYLVSQRARQALEQSQDHITALLPIFLSLPDLALSGTTLQSFLVDLVEHLRIDKSFANVLWSEIEHGRAFVALDGLDEVIPTRRSQIIELINGIASEHGNIWLVGSRFTEYKGGQLKRGQFTEWELLSMTPQLRLELASKLLPELSRSFMSEGSIPASSSEFVRLIEEHPHAAAWGENPLLFSLAAVVFVKTGELPASRASLYRDVIEAVLAFKEPNHIARRHLLRPLTSFALWLYQEKKARTFTLDELLIFLEDIQKRSWEEAEIIAQKITYSGILDIVAHETYGFRHQTFLEYLAALELAQQLTGLKEERKRALEFVWSKRTYSRWTEVLRLMVGVLAQLPGRKGQPEAIQWLKRLVDQRTTNEGDPGDLGLTLVLTSLAEIANTERWERENAKRIIQLENLTITLWVRELLDSARNGRGSRLKRFQRLTRDVASLHTVEKKTTIQYLLKALSEQSYEVWEAAFETLEVLGKWIPLEYLLPLLEEPDINIRLSVLRILGTMGEQVPSDRLIHLLENANDEEYEEVVRTLCVLGKQVPLEYLFRLLKTPHWPMSELVLNTIGKQIPLEHLLSLLENPVWQVRLVVVQVLGTLSEQAPLDCLLSQLKHPAWLMRQTVVEVLGTLDKQVPLEYLLPLLEDPNIRVRKAVVEALGSQIPLELLLPLIKDQDSDVREAVVRMLGKQVSSEYFLPFLKDSDSNVRKAVVETLGSQIPSELLLPLLKDSDSDVRKAVVETLGVSIPLEWLLFILENPSYGVHRVIGQVLVALEDQFPLGRLLILIENRDSNTRQAAVEIIGMSEEQTSLELLFPLLEDPNIDVRRATVEALGLSIEQVPLDRLLSLLEDSSSLVRKTVVEVLGTQTPIGSLLQMLEDPSSYVRQTVVVVLSTLEEQMPLNCLLSLLEDPDDDVRYTVIKTLETLKLHISLDILFPLLKDSNSKVRCTVVRILGNLNDCIPGSRIISDNLLDLLMDQSKSVRWAVKQALLGFPNGSLPLNYLLFLLEEADSNFHRATLALLESKDKQVSLDHLLPLLEDRDSDIRKATVHVLETIEEQVSLDHLFPLLEDSDSDVRQAAVEFLKKQKERLSISSVRSFFYCNDGDLWQLAAEIVEVIDEQVPLDLLVDLLSCEESDVRLIALRILKKQDAQMFSELVSHALVVLNGQISGEIFLTLTQIHVATIIGELGIASTVFLEKLTKLLDWPHWQVRWQAAYALGQIRRNIPDAAIQRLLELRRDPDPKMRVVREAADDALAEILSLETGIEDD